MNGLFITFEGIDGAGKSSHIQAVTQAFREQSKGDGQGEAAGRQVVLTREPGGTALSEQLRDMILHTPMDALTEALLVFAARREHIVQVIAPALARGDVVLCDRFSDASFAYQGAGRGFSLNTLSKLERFTQDLHGLEPEIATNVRLPSGLLQPDLTLVFDVPPDVAAQRLALARQPDKFESQNLAFFERVAAGYAARMAADPQRFVRINGHQSLEAVRSDVMVALQAKGYLSRGAQLAVAAPVAGAFPATGAVL